MISLTPHELSHLFHIYLSVSCIISSDYSKNKHLLCVSSTAHTTQYDYNTTTTTTATTKIISLSVQANRTYTEKKLDFSLQRIKNTVHSLFLPSSLAD
jgi:hypothetical protein